MGHRWASAIALSLCGLRNFFGDGGFSEIALINYSTVGAKLKGEKEKPRFSSNPGVFYRF
jgi:hypothetical protein